MRPLFFIASRFSQIHIIVMQGRIGPLACIPEYCARMVQMGEIDPKDRFVFILESRENNSLIEIVRRRWPVFVAERFNEFVANVFSGLEQNDGQDFALKPLNKPFALAKGATQFSKDEDARGRRLLADMGIGADQWFVCFHSRDPSYLNARFPKQNWSYHSYRDTDITRSRKAMEYIAGLGGVAVRVGSHPHAPIEPGPGIIDYASNYRDEFGDIYLLAKCRFMVGCSSGLTGVATMFDVPVAMNNLIPYAPGPHGPCDIFTPKLVWSHDQKRHLSFDECRELGLFDPFPQGATQSFYDDNRLSPVENSEDEVLGLCMDMLDRLDGRQPDSELTDLQERFNTRYYANFEDIQYRTRIGPRFLSKYRHLMG